MRIAILSDTHFGDRLSALAYKDSKTGTLRIREDKYSALKKSLTPKDPHHKPYLDYLILIGDIFDFSVASYQESYEVGQLFFQRLKNDEITSEIIYIPGNHDFDLWHTIEYQVNVINRILKKHIPTQFRMSVPGVLDLRKNSKKKVFSIPAISAHENQEHKYAGLFLDHITQPASAFNFVYPNLYIATDEGSLIVTHGQYLESFWCFLGEELHELAHDDIHTGDTIDMNELVSLNFPFCQLASSGIGQAGKLSRIAQDIQHEIYGKETTRIAKYLDRLNKQIKKYVDQKYGKFIGALYQFFLPKWIKKTILEKLTNFESTRYNQDFFNLEIVQKRTAHFYGASIQEMVHLNQQYYFELPVPDKIIFGHTHQPIAWDDPKAPFFQYNGALLKKKVSLYNTGGWVYNKNGSNLEFTGAEIFLYESGKGFWSERIH